MTNTSKGAPPSQGAPADGFSRATDDYLLWLTVERGVSPNTLAAYRRDLRRYLAFLHSQGLVSPEEVGEATVARYVHHLKTIVDDDDRPRLKPASIARAVVAVRSFHRFLVDEGTVENDPTQDVTTPRVPQGIPKALTEDEVGRLLLATGDFDQVSTARQQWRALRDRALLETLYASGVRISELAGLELGDVDLEAGILRVFGKGAKERVVPVGRPAQDAVLAYLERARPELIGRRRAARGRDTVFLNLRGGPITRQGCWLIVKAVGERAGLGDRLSPHVLRHSCATHMVDHGADIRVVQELLGHAKVTTTQIYTKVSPERLRAVYESAHPRARMPSGSRRR